MGGQNRGEGERNHDESFGGWNHPPDVLVDGEGVQPDLVHHAILNEQNEKFEQSRDRRGHDHRGGERQEIHSATPTRLRWFRGL